MAEQYTFGTGQLFATPVGGGAPFRFGALQDVSVDFSADVKQLFGQYQFPLDVARGKTKIEGKAATGQVNAAAFNTYYFGQTVTDGQEMLQAINEAASVPGMMPFTVTVANAADFIMDLGVYVAATGEQLTQVASAPAQGEYTVSNVGVYTFNSMDANLALLFNYLYEGSTGADLAIGNPLMGATPKFQMVLSQIYNGNTTTLLLYSCTAEKLSLPFKQDDYLIADMSFQAQANSAGQVGRFSTTQTG